MVNSFERLRQPHILKDLVFQVHIFRYFCSINNFYIISASFNVVTNTFTTNLFAPAIQGDLYPKYATKVS